MGPLVSNPCNRVCLCKNIDISVVWMRVTAGAVTRLPKVTSTEKWATGTNIHHISGELHQKVTVYMLLAELFDNTYVIPLSLVIDGIDIEHINVSDVWHVFDRF